MIEVKQECLYDCFVVLFLKKNQIIKKLKYQMTKCAGYTFWLCRHKSW